MPSDDRDFDLMVRNNLLHHWEEPTGIVRQVHRVLKPRRQALSSDLRSDAPEDDVLELALQIDSWIMHWDLRHSFKDGHAVHVARQLVAGIPLANVHIGPSGASRAIYLET